MFLIRAKSSPALYRHPRLSWDLVLEEALTYSSHISDLALQINLGNPLLSHLSAIQLGSHIFSLDELPFSSDGAKQPLTD